MRIPSFPGLHPVALLTTAIRQFFKHDMPTYAAALTYHTLFALFPFVLFLLALLGFFDVPHLLDWLRQQAQQFFLENTVRQVNDVFGQLKQRRQGLLSFGVIFSLWTASYSLRAAINALNVIHGIGERRALWKVYLLSMLYTPIIGMMLLAAAILLVVRPAALHWIAQQAGWDQSTAMAWMDWLRWPLVVLLLTLAVAMIYDLGAEAGRRFRFITPGAFVAVLVWIVASLLFHYCVQTVLNFNAMYGSVGTMIVLLFYFFISSLVLLFGAEINIVIEQHADDKHRRSR